MTLIVFFFSYVGFTSPALSNHPGRAALISGIKRQSIINSNRAITSNATSASTPTFSNVDHIRSYSLSRTFSDQPSRTGSGSSTPSSSRRTSTSESNEKPRRGSSQMLRGPKSLRACHEQPGNLLEQPSLKEKVNVQILSPNTNQTYSYFHEDDFKNKKSKSEENLNIEDNNSTVSSSNMNEK